MKNKEENPSHSTVQTVAGGVSQETLKGLGGIDCTRHDILVAANATNDLSEKFGIATQLFNGLFRTDIKWGCAPEYIQSQSSAPHPVIDKTGTAAKNLREEAAVNVVRNRMVEHGMNAFRPHASLTPPRLPSGGSSSKARPSIWRNSSSSSSSSYSWTPSSWRSSSLSSNAQSSSSTLFSWRKEPSSFDVRRAVEGAVRQEMNSYMPSVYSAYWKASSALGFGYHLSFGQFSMVARTTNLTSSYNNFNPSSKIRSVMNFCRDIGGVASEVSMIEDLINSEAHALAADFILCFPGNSLNQDWVKQIAREIKEAYTKHKTSPFLSLHFNNDGYMYPVIHPSFQNTLMGEIITILDYWMKGYLNGGIFDEKFIEEWHQTANCDEKNLRAHLIDLKKHCQEQCPNLSYVSLRELMNRYGIGKEEISASHAYQQPFMTSFRIIAHQEKVERHGNVLVFSPAIRVEYSIDLMPDYEKFINNYYKEHGSYPPDFEQTRNCYQQFAEEIKEKMPKLPFCKPFFDLLGVANAYNYFFATLDKMGKEAVLADMPSAKPYHVPKSLPPIPVSYFKTHQLELSFASVLEKFVSRLGEAAADELLASLFNFRRLSTIPQPLLQAMQSTVISMIEEQFPGTELNQEEVNRIVGKCCRPLYGYTLNVYQEINTFIGEKMQRFASNERRSIQQLPVNQKLRHVLAYFQRRFEEVKLRWENNPSLVRTEFEQELPQEAYEAMRARLSAIDQMVSSEEELAGQLLLSLQAQKEEAIQQQLSALQAAIAKLTADEQAGEQNIAHLNQALANRQANLQQAQQEIIRLNGLLQQLIGSRAPGNLIAAHRAQINAEIARIQGLIPQIQAEINQISTILQGVNQGMAELRAYKSDLVQNGERKIRAEIEEKVAVRVAEIEALKGTLPQRIADALRSLGIEMLTKACSPDIEALKSTDESIQHFSRIIATGEEEHHHSVSKKYTHRVLGFSSQDIAKETNERFRIVGGCGMSLPNLTSKPLPQADLFLEVLAENCSDQQEEISTFSCRGKSYSAQRMTTQFIPMVKKITSPHQEDILQWLTQIAEAENIPEQFPETLLEQPLDASGAKLIHYAAQLLPGPLFEALLAKNPNQANYTDSLGHLPIHVASQEGNLEVVLSILSCFPEQKDSFTQSGMTPLLLATQHGQTAIVEALVQQGVDANKRLPNGLFPLYIAIQNNFSEMALLLLEKVPHLITNEKLDSGMTPLHQAIEFDLQAVALQLIAKGAKGDVKRKSDGYTPLHLAAASGQLEVLTAIVNSGISASLELESHQHALHLAAQNGHLDIVNTLLSLNVDVNTKDDAGNTPLMCAIKSGHADIALRLAEVAKIDEQNARGQTVSSLALMYGLPEVADRLIARGENILLCDDEQQHSFYHFIRNSEYQRVAALIEEKPQLLAIQYQDLNLLELSAKFKQTYLVYLFLNQGLQFANDHRTTLAKFAVKVDEMSLLRDCIEPEIIPELTVIAAESGSYRCLAELLPQLKTSEIDSLELLKKAIASGHLETIRLVISKCSNINKPLDSMGNTALHLATNLGLREVIELLLESGSDITLSNHASQTAFHIAIVQNDHYLLKRLFKLTKPSEWPKQLQLDGIKREAPIEKLLQRYAVRTGNRTEQVVNAASPVFYQGLLPQDKVEELALLLKQSNFVGASDLLEECPDVINAFKTEEGGAFLRLVFANIQDIDGGAEERESISPKRFLNQLKQAHVNPALYTGQQNTLLSMVTAEDDKTACERFKYFIEFFSDALPTLVQDKIGKIQTVSQLALRHNKRDLFHQLHTFYLASANSQFDVTMISALHEAVLSEQYDLVEHFLQHHPVDSFNHKKQTALMLAAAQGNTRIVALLMNQGADAEKRDIEGHSALHYALFAKKEDVALTLIPYMSNPNRANRYGVTPLSLASANGILSVVRFIVEGKNYTQQVDDTGKTALHHAALKGQEKVIEYLVSQGFDVNAVDAPTRPSKQRSCKKTTPLHCAASKGHARAVMKLLALGADPTLSDSRGKTVCDYAVFSQDKEMQSVVEQLAMYQQKEQQVSLLFTAVQTDHLEVFDTLILEGADLSVLDGEGLSLAHRCAQFDAIKILKRLLIGDDTILELTDKLGNSALHYAAIRGHVSIIDYLVAAGASINLRNQENKSALYMACEQGKLGAVIALMKGNADVTLKSYEGLTPLQVALLNGHISIAYELALIGDTSWKLPAIQALTPEQQQKIMEGPYIAFMATYQKTDTMRMERGIFHHGLFKIGPVNHIGQERTNELSAV